MRFLPVLSVSILFLGAGALLGDSSADRVLRVAMSGEVFSGEEGTGPYAGLARDMVELIARKMGRRVAFTSEDKADVTLGAFPELDPQGVERYSPVILRVPTILVGCDSGPRITNETELRGLTLGVGKRYGLQAFAARHCEGFQTVDVESDLFGLMKVSLGELDLMLIDLATASQLIEEEGLTNLRLVARLGPLYSFRLRLTGADEPLVADLLSAVDHIRWHERRTLSDRWLGFGAVPFHRNPLFWAWVGGGTAFFLLLLGNVLLWNRALRREVKLRKQMARDILSISSDERARIGRDLHDSIGQQLVGVTYLAGLAGESADAGNASEASALAERIRRHVEETIQQTRFIVRGLLPVDLQEEGLVAALEKLARDTAAMSRTECEFESHDNCRGIAVSSAVHLYRIAQEAIGNALKHGVVGSIRVCLDREGGTCTLTITDDGHGMRDASGSEGMGLRIMQYRAQIIGGSLEITRRRKAGTRVVCRFPAAKSKDGTR